MNEIMYLKAVCTFFGGGGGVAWVNWSYARVQLPENIATISYYLIFDPEIFKLSLERDFFW